MMCDYRNKCLPISLTAVNRSIPNPTLASAAVHHYLLALGHILNLNICVRIMLYIYIYIKIHVCLNHHYELLYETIPDP